MYRIKLVIPEMYCTECRERIIRRISQLTKIQRIESNIVKCALVLFIAKRLSSKKLKAILNHGRCKAELISVQCIKTS